MDNSKYILNEVGKGLQMGMDSISNITQKVDDANLKEDLLYQYSIYGSLLDRVNTEISHYSDVPEYKCQYINGSSANNVIKTLSKFIGIVI